MPSIKCTCGTQVAVREGQAGTVVRCRCGLELTVPDVYVLRRRSENGQPARAGAVEEQGGEVEVGKTLCERRLLVFLTDRRRLQNRISFDAASHYVMACERLLDTYFSLTEHQWDVDLQVSVALLSDGGTLVDIQAQPAVFPDQAAEELAGRLRELPSPPVRGGPVAFAIRRPVCGGAPVDCEFDIPFPGLLQQGGDLDQVLLEVDGLGSKDAGQGARRTWLTRLWSWLRGLYFTRLDFSGWNAARRKPASRWSDSRRRKSFATGIFRCLKWKRSGRELDERRNLCHAEDPEIDAAIASNSVARMEACLERNPHVVRLRESLGAVLLKEGKYPEAVAAYTKLLRLDPNNLAAYRCRGRANCLAGSMQQGLADYTRAIEGDPDDAESRAGRGMLYLELEAWDAAEADLSAAIERDTIQPQLYVERARVHYIQQKTTEAREDLRRALQLDPHCAEAYVLSGWICQHMPDATLQDIVEAARHYSRALEADPDNVMCRVQRAETYASQSKYALAIADCDAVLEMAPENAMAYGLRGYAHQQLENMSTAVADCTKAIELGLESAAVHVSRAVAYTTDGEVDRALADCDAAIQLAPDYAPAFNYRGMLRLAEGDMEAAMQDFAEASRLEPSWAAPREYRANAHRMQSQFEQAIDDYTDTIELEPDNATAYIGRALAWMEQQEFDNAWRDLTRALRIDEKCVPAYFHRAELFMRREQFEDALNDLHQAIELDADFAAAYHARAQMYLHLDRNEEAVRDFSKLIDLHPSWPGGYVGRANAWIRLGKSDKASADYREAANLDPGSTEDLMVHRLVVEAHHLHDQEDYEAAVAKATEAVDLDEHSLPALVTRAANYWYAEHFVEAVEDYSQVLELDPDAVMAYVGRGQAYAEVGEYELALDDLNKAVEMQRDGESGSGLAYALNGRALAAAGLRRFDEARRDFQESIRLRPNNAWTHYNQGLLYRMLNDLPRAAESFRQALELEEPQLNKRKRKRAEAFLQQYGQ
ncbi:MAG: tetratricopeptide repeat protein [Pirellulaceae bacterium]